MKKEIRTVKVNTLGSEIIEDLKVEAYLNTYGEWCADGGYLEDEKEVFLSLSHGEVIPFEIDSNLLYNLENLDNLDEDELVKLLNCGFLKDHEVLEVEEVLEALQ